MYRKLLFLFLCGRTLTAPQQDIETIAVVKPTIFDYPAEVYDLPVNYPAGEYLSGGRPYSAIYDMTTENIELETTDYNEELTGYEKNTESIPRDYESRENTAEIYSKIGLFTNNYLPGRRRLENKEGNQINIVDMKYTDIVTEFDTNNSTKDEFSRIEETTIKSEVELSAIDAKLSDSNNTDEVGENFTESKNILDNQNFKSTPNIKNIPNIVEVKPNYELSKPSHFSSGRKGYINEKLIQKGKRKFRSNCRCEKIWNCPKLQITVPRCPDEYFMCCF